MDTVIRPPILAERQKENETSNSIKALRIIVDG